LQYHAYLGALGQILDTVSKLDHGLLNIIIRQPENLLTQRVISPVVSSEWVPIFGHAFWELGRSIAGQIGEVLDKGIRNLLGVIGLVTASEETLVASLGSVLREYE
jgi:hypothetical protein